METRDRPDDPPGSELRIAITERHASRVLATAIVVGTIIVAFEAIRASQGLADGFDVAIVTCVLALLVLVYVLTARTVRFATTSARRHLRESRALMRAAGSFAEAPAGALGSAEALCRSARSAGCDALLWDDAARALWSPVSGERHGVSVAAGHRLVSSLRGANPLVVLDLEVFSALPSALTQRFGSNALVASAMWDGEHLLGLVFKRYDSAHGLRRAAESSLVVSIASIGAVALTKAHALEREQEHVRDAMLLLQSVQSVNASTAQEQVVRAAQRNSADEHDDASPIHALAGQVETSLERQQRLWKMGRRRSKHLASMPKLARALTGQREPDEVARIAARELHDGFGFGRVSIALADESGLASLRASRGMLAQTAEPLATTAIFDHVFVTAQPYVCCAGDDAGDALRGPTPDPNAPAGCRSQIVVPVMGANHRCVGAVAVYERDPDALGEDDLHMLETVADQLAGTLEQATLFATLERSYFKTVEALAAALEAKDAYTLSHAQSITETSAAVGRRLGMREDEIKSLKLGALLHDIGKIGVPGRILNKNGPLTDAEFEVMKQHTVIGEQIIAPIEFLDDVRPLVLHEHERWDGAGYPHGLRGHDIPLGARIIFVCDAYHAMTSNRPYRQALPEDEAQKRLRRGAGSQFDPQVVDAFLEVLAAEASAPVEA